MNRFYRKSHFWKKILQSKMDKQTRIRNTNKKQPLLYRQSQNFYTGMVPWIEMPNAYLSKKNIPNDKKNSRSQQSRKQSFPKLALLHSFFKAVQKRNDEGGYV